MPPTDDDRLGAAAGRSVDFTDRRSGVDLTDRESPINVEGDVSPAPDSIPQSIRDVDPPGGKSKFRLVQYVNDNPKKAKLVGGAALAIIFIAYVLSFGIPYSSDVILLWVTGALFVSSIGDTGRWRRSIVRDWLPLYLVLVVYDLLRGYASHTLWGPFVRPQVWFDTHLFGGVDPTVRLQHWLFNAHDLHVWDYAAVVVYTSHFFASFVIAGFLWKINYSRFRRFVPLFVGLTALGYITYVLYPAMPPWLASKTGHLPPTTRIIPVVWDHLGIHYAAALFTGGNEFDNNIAAMPSLHAAYPMLICLFFWRGASRPLRALLIAYPIAMGFTLVYTGEHFVIDLLVGWTYAVMTYFVGSRILDRLESRKIRKKLGFDGRENDNLSLHEPIGQESAGVGTTSAT